MHDIFKWTHWKHFPFCLWFVLWLVRWPSIRKRPWYSIVLPKERREKNRRFIWKLKNNKEMQKKRMYNCPCCMCSTIIFPRLYQTWLCGVGVVVAVAVAVVIKIQQRLKRKPFFFSFHYLIFVFFRHCSWLLHVCGGLPRANTGYGATWEPVAQTVCIDMCC